MLNLWNLQRMNYQNMSVYSSSITAVLQVAERLGASKKELLAAIDIDDMLLVDPESRFPVTKLFSLYKLTERATNNPDIGVYSGRFIYTNGLNLQLYMSTICESFRDYLQLMPSMMKFIGDTGEIKTHAEGELIRLEWNPMQEGTKKNRYLSDIILNFSAVIAHSLCILPIGIVKAHFTYPKPDDCSFLQAAFGDNLSFSQANSCIYFSRKCLNNPIIHVDYKLTPELTEPLSRLFDDTHITDEFSSLLHKTIIRMLPTGALTIDAVAKALNVSKRTLQRRLTSRDTQFLYVVQSIRSNFALRYLSDRRLTIAEIGFLLGYSEQGAFSAAFKTWHGVSPLHYRRQSD